MKTALKLIISLLFLACFLIADDNKTTDDGNILDAVYALQRINSQIQIISSDTNASVATNIQTLKNRKYRLLSQIPDLITKMETSKSQSEKFEVKKSNLQKAVAKYSKNKNSDNYVKSVIALDIFTINDIFFKHILELKKMFDEGTKTAKIKELLESAIIEIRTLSYENISEINPDLAKNYTKEINQVDISKSTNEEILVYLKDNADLLNSSFVINELNLKTAIEYINQKDPFKFESVNFGKTIFILIIFAFFVSLTRLLAKFTYWLIISSRKELKSSSDEMKDQILQIVKKPISALLVTYALKLCIAVGYYPAPMPLVVANTFTIIYIMLFSWLVITILNGYGMLVIGEFAKKSGRKEVVNLILKLIYFIVIVITILLVLARLGVNISALIASLGIGGLAVAFAAKDIIANFFASVMLLVDNSFSQGDVITCGNIEGTIVEVGLRNTTIRSADNALIFVPNSTLASSSIVNWSRRKVGRIINLTIGLTYDSKPEALKVCIAQIKEMLVAHQDISKQDDELLGMHHFRFRRSIVSIDDLVGYKNAIYVSLDALNDSSIDIAITCFTKVITKGEYIVVKEDILFKIMDIVAQNGLEFAFPSQSLYVKNSSDQQFLTNT